MSKRAKPGIIRLLTASIGLSLLILAGSAMAAIGSGDSPLFLLDTYDTTSTPDSHEPPLALHPRQVCPNPFNPATTITYDLPHASTVDLTVFDLKGRVVCTLRDGVVEPAGGRKAIWNGCDDRGQRVSGGVNICRLRTDGFTAFRAMALVE
ncbi:hypothetical protein KKA85_11705 [bacterium]|nr:hypothetical protein [bacterium]